MSLSNLHCGNGLGPGHSLEAACASCTMRAGNTGGPSRKFGSLTKGDSRSGFRRIQLIMGIAFLLSTAVGTYLLVTDGSLWRLAVSHAYGLVLIIVIDAILGVLNLSSRSSVYVPSLAAAALGFLLQVGDIATAPQYKMTISYFAGYLFGLWAFDLLLGLQLAVLVAGVLGRSYASYLSRVRRGKTGKPLSYSRRDFAKAFVLFAGAIATAVLAASVKLPAPQQNTQTQTSTSSLPNGAVYDSKQLRVGSPAYFEYPTGYPNILFKNSDGTLTALSLLCTHVCCECSYDQASNYIYCPCHGSVFDAKGQVLRGPAQTPLPSIKLTVDSAGLVYAESVNGSGPCVA